MLTEAVRQRATLWAGAVLCVAFLLPNHYSPWLTFHQELAAAIAFVPLLIWACAMPQRPSSVVCWVILLSGLPLFQLGTGLLYFGGDAWISTLYLLGLGLAFHAGYRLVGGRGGAAATSDALARLEPLWLAFVFAALASAGIALHQWLQLERLTVFVVDLPPAYRPFANLAQPNQLATLLLLGMMGVMYLWENRRASAVTVTAASFVMVFGLVLTGSRSVLLTLMWVIPGYFLLRGRSRLRTGPTAFVLIVMMYAAISACWTELNSVLLLPAGEGTAVGRMGQLGTREVFWRAMLDAVQRAPWTGYGWAQVSLAQTAVALDHPPTYSYFDSAHNLFLDLALWAGVPFAILVAMALGAWCVWQLRRCAHPLGWVTLAAIGIVFSHAMIEYPLNYAYFLLPVALFMGSMTALQPSPLDAPVRRGARAARLLVRVAGMTAICLLIVICTEYFPYEGAWRAMRFREARIGTGSVAPLPPTVLLTNLHELLRVTTTEPRAGLPGPALDAMRKVAERYPYSSIMYRYALTQALNGHLAGAAQTLAKLCQMQKEALCEDARFQWSRSGRNEYPQLLAVPFPEN